MRENLSVKLKNLHFKYHDLDKVVAVALEIDDL